jgi:hypothetical protein
MSFAEFQKPFHYPSGQDDPSSTGNDMISEFPGSFRPTTYHTLIKESLAPVMAEGLGNVFPIKCARGDYLTDVYLTMEIPREIGFTTKAQVFSQKSIESVELQWASDTKPIQTLKSRWFDENFRWRFRTITETIYRSAPLSVDADEEQIVVIAKLPWFFGKELKSGIPLFYIRGLDATKQPLQVKINFTPEFDQTSNKVKFGFIAEYAQISDEERNHWLGLGDAPKNPNRNKRVVYEEITLDQMKPSTIVNRMSWKDSDTVVEITPAPGTSTGTIVLDPSVCPELHWDFFGNEWAQDYKRFSYSVAAPPGRASSSILSGIPFSRIRLAETGKEEDIRFVVQRLVTFSQNTIKVDFQ